VGIKEGEMKRLLLIGSAIAALAWGSVAAYASTTTVTTASPWAYACGHTTFGTATATATDPGATCAHGTTGNVGYCRDAQSQPVADTPGAVAAAFASAKLTLTKEGPTCDDMSAGATVKGLTTLTAASWDLAEGSYCQAGAPRLDVVTSDGKTHFFGCLANKSGSHVSFNLTAAGDGNTALPVESRGIVGKTVTSIDIVQDETGTAILMNLSFKGTAVVTATPTPTPTTSHLATTGGGGGDVPLWPIGVFLAALGLGLGSLAIRRRAA
jgi:hypothetical protein